MPRRRQAAALLSVHRAFVRPWLNGYERRLRSVQARELVPQAIRQSLLDAVAAVKADADVLRRGLACPADAGTP